MKVYLGPEPKDDTSGLAQVLKYYRKYLPQWGIELADETQADVKVSHAGALNHCDVAHLHGLNWTADFASMGDYEYRLNARIIANIREAKCVIAPSQWVAETLKRDMHLAPFVIGHGVEWRDWQVSGNALPDERIVLWNKNRMDAVCDPMPFIELSRRSKQARFVSTFGPAGENVRITGPLPFDQMRQLILQTWVYVATTKETFGIGTLEAMAAGVPVLGFDYGGTSDLIEHKETGYLVAPGDIEALREGLDYCLQHRTRLGGAARQAARAYDWESIAGQVAEAYAQALDESAPTVGVVIPCYNKAGTVKRAIESVCAQTRKPDKLVVVDDGSTDDSFLAYQDALFTALHVHKIDASFVKQANGGVARARNEGLLKLINVSAPVKYVSFLDADDEIAPGFLEVCVNALQHDPKLGIAYTPIGLRSADGRLTHSPWPTGFNYDRQIARRNQVPTCCVIRADALRRAGGYRPMYCPTGAGSEDAELWLRIGAMGYSAKLVTDQPMFIYRPGQGHTSQAEYREVDWTQWHPWCKDFQFPFASVATPRNYSHPVRQYDQPRIAVFVSKIDAVSGFDEAVFLTLDSLEAQSYRNWSVFVYGTLSRPTLDAFPYAKSEWRLAPVILTVKAGEWLLPDVLTWLSTAPPGAYHYTNHRLFCQEVFEHAKA